MISQPFLRMALGGALHLPAAGLMYLAYEVMLGLYYPRMQASPLLHRWFEGQAFLCVPLLAGVLEWFGRQREPFKDFVGGRLLILPMMLGILFAAVAAVGPIVVAFLTRMALPGVSAQTRLDIVSGLLVLSCAVGLFAVTWSRARDIRRKSGRRR